MRNILFGLSLCVLFYILCWFVLDPDGASSGIVSRSSCFAAAGAAWTESEEVDTTEEPRPADSDVGRPLSRLVGTDCSANDRRLSRNAVFFEGAFLHDPHLLRRILARESECFIDRRAQPRVKFLACN